MESAVPAAQAAAKTTCQPDEVFLPPVVSLPLTLRLEMVIFRIPGFCQGLHERDCSTMLTKVAAAGLGEVCLISYMW